MRKLLLIAALITATLSAVEAQTRTTKDGYPASVSKEMVEKASLCLAQHDLAAAQKMIDDGLIISLKAGIQVEIMEISGALAKIRPRGATVEFWTNIEAVRQ